MQKIFSALRYIYERACLLFLLFSLWLTIEFVLFGSASYGRVPDHLDSFVPRAVVLKGFFSSWDIPHWQATIAGGIDRLSNMTSLSEIGNMLFTLLPVWLATGMILVLGSWLGSWFVFKICREVFLLNRASSLFAGLAFGYSIVLVDISPYVLGLAVFPVVLYFLEKICFSASYSLQRKSIYVFLLGVLFSWFSSLILTLPFSFAMILVWFTFVRRKVSVPFLVLLGFFAVPVFILKFQEAWALVINSPLSQRGGTMDYFHSTFLNYLLYVKELIVQNILTLSVIMIGLILSRKRNIILTRSLIVLGALLFVARLYKPFASTFGDYFNPLRNFDFSRFYLYVPFFASVCSGFVLDQIGQKDYVSISERERIEQRYSLKRIIFVGICVVLFVLTFQLKWVHLNSWYRFGSYTANTYSPDVKEALKDVDKTDPFRVVALRSEKNSFNINLPQYHDLESFDGYADLTTIRSIEFFRLLAREPSIKSDLRLMISDAKTDDFKNNPLNYISPALLSLANVRYIFSNVIFSMPGFSLVTSTPLDDFYEWNSMDYKEKILFKLKENFGGRKLLVYENQEVFPRFFLTKKVRLFDDEQSLFDALQDASAATLRSEAFFESADVGDYFFPVLSGSAEGIMLDSYSPDAIVVHVNSDGPSVFVFTNNYNPSWKVYVNGVESTIIPAYHTFMAVVLNENENKVVFEYDPAYDSLSP